MSADNGIYILKSPKDNGDGFEFRVTHAQAIENIYWNPDANEEGPDVNPKSLIDYFGECELLTEQDAQDKALAIEKEILDDDFCPILEYGINTLEVPRSFLWYREKASE